MKIGNYIIASFAGVLAGLNLFGVISTADTSWGGALTWIAIAVPFIVGALEANSFAFHDTKEIESHQRTLADAAQAR